MISHMHSRFSGERASSFDKDGSPTSVIKVCVKGASASRMSWPMRLKRKTALSKTGLDSGKSVSAGKNVDHTFQNSGGDFVSVSTSSCARFANVSNTFTDVSSICRIRSLCCSCDSPRWSAGMPSRHCSMKETMMSFSLRASIIRFSSSDSCTMLRTSGFMMSVAGFTKSAGCWMPAKAPTEVCGSVTAFKSACFALAAALWR
mmetsp:Transcript_43943/g.124140  ORF Transcript_43943/g.124140 Transcript_43943/m.124140 type:complete len:203 (-) Transcript_43943:866-1474(-)